MLGKYFGPGRSGAFDWYFQRISGAFLVFGLFLHFAVLHFFTEPPLTYDKVMARLSSPLWKAFDILFLVFAVYHAMNGFKLIIDDYVHSSAMRAFAIGLLWVVSLAFFVMGFLTIISL
ncbi:MAG: succinate dehydrogenase, hydrophobic membrane anchor protein [Deltaproteobacteria bacterium]|nr:succinate dehydrogenase, hydrophobic membrane anchor protein [Deltaproteobacteria bacterium]MBW2069266.1 succinate dehydrogenase, hydrophobic membrane anchor protein [Deltaproteobacteria bacterium]